LAGARPSRRRSRDGLRGLARWPPPRRGASPHARTAPRAQRARRARGRRGPRDPVPDRGARARRLRRHPSSLRGEGGGAGHPRRRRLRASSRGDPRDAPRRARRVPAAPRGRVPAASVHADAGPLRGIPRSVRRRRRARPHRHLLGRRGAPRRRVVRGDVPGAQAPRPSGRAVRPGARAHRGDAARSRSTRRRRADARRRRHPPDGRRAPLAPACRRDAAGVALMADARTTALLDAMRSRLGDRARADEPLARHTSFRIGGPADLLVVPDTVDELAHVLRTAHDVGARVTLLGGGSNVLVGDGGMRGVVVKLGRGFARVRWGRLERAAVERGLAGLEYAEGIPGTVGGALFMNAGAYGGEVSEAFAGVEGLDGAGQPLALDALALAFRYRRAELPPGFVVTAVRFRLRYDDPTALRARLDATRSRRVAAQPQGRANAGSMFKNPARDHAGRLIDAAGLKGARAGRARISERHANFIVNEGGARAAD